MSVLYLTEGDVRELLPMPVCIDLMESVFKGLAGGAALNHPRRRLVLPTGATLHYMAGSDGAYFGAKIYSSHPKHGAHFLFLLYDAANAEPLAIIEANHLGQIRTGAASGLATKLLARPDAATLGIVGSGFQALTQLEAMRAVRPIREARVWSRSAEKRAAFAVEASARFGIAVHAAETAGQAVRGADIVVTATFAKDPVLAAEWISPGTHINAMGSNRATRREIPAELVRRADLIAVDSLEQARMEAGDLLLAFEEKDWDDPRVVELKTLAAGTPIRREGQITLFKSIGLAVEDAIAAGYVYRRALETNRGTRMPGTA